MKNIRIFYLEKFPFLAVKFSIYLNRRVFVMYLVSEDGAGWLRCFSLVFKICAVRRLLFTLYLCDIGRLHSKHTTLT